MPAPIALFVYNRPWHTKKTVEALQKNSLAQESDLYIFGEEPGEKYSEQIEELRVYTRSISGFRTVTIAERERGFGLDRAVITGVTELINRYGEVIVLEDDVQTSPFFLKYMNDALELYKEQPEVMHVGGFMFPIETDGLLDTIFIRSPTIWGWGTWKRAWDCLNSDLQQPIPALDFDQIYRFDMDGTFDYWNMLQGQRMKDGYNTWDILWYLTVFLRNGKCLAPSHSLTNNIGRDGSGSHKENSDCFEVQISNEVVSFFETSIEENCAATEALKRFFVKLRPPRHRRYLQKILGFLK